ncbi:MAG: hypothetical protein ACR2OF_00600 [Hyphomicrobium sp.]
MKNRLGILVCVLAPLIVAQPSLAQEGQLEPMEEADAETPSPLGDPYEPEPGDPDPFASEDAPGEEPSPLNPADN